MGTTLEILFVLLLTLLNGIFAMSELAVVSSRKSRLLALERRGSAGAAAAIALQEDPQRFLPTVQVGITLVGILAGVFGGAALAKPLGDWFETLPWVHGFGQALAFGLVVVAITYVNLILGELVPKQLALRNPEAVAVALARPLTALARFTAPFIWLLSRSSALILRLFGKPPPEQTVTEEEVKAVVAESVEAGALDQNERQMIERVLRLADRPVRALMTPRTEVAWLDRNAQPEDLAVALRAENLTRFVVADRRVDNVVGVVAVKDLLDRSLAGAPLDLGAVLRQPIVLPDNLSALDALERLRADALGLALVLDEYGSFEGVITASDLLEAIVGELGPAPASDKPAAVERFDGSLLLDGMMALDELRGRLAGFEPPPQSAAYHTVAGLMLSLLQRIPREGDRIAHGGWRFEIVDMDGRRVDKVMAVREDSLPEAPAAEAATAPSPPPSRSAG
ncbi:MAG: hemolysin family protein [Rubritepida sp.]|jgi:putative hemolysin|nr:hemolysin family protein [Rubritepida sp.]MCU0944115.1 hemolysin family protein [Rubritepida sp.]